ncbi:MAG: hypothetical protein I3273_07700 [Candidatus Moeniiplasma glomeromycotorum]|nr:hypothetical protein [Candidatus Moeniiplasma glomeromycotorum]MCE8168419.1 hypothetical protein [Candidatus Moeniiplasma glomeromycotorum]MCE8169964.1 hypothetical protein [Candidatus Moeniiplasma glomeromycotorum]
MKCIFCGLCQVHCKCKNGCDECEEEVEREGNDEYNRKDNDVLEREKEIEEEQKNKKEDLEL